MVPHVAVALLSGCIEGGSVEPAPGPTDLAPTDEPTVSPLQLDGHVIPGPGEDVHDPTLAALVDGHDRVFSALGGVPTGLSVSTDVTVDPALITDWVQTGTGSGSSDLHGHLGLPADELVVEYRDLSHQGLIGGFGAVGDLYRYALMRDDPGSVPGDLGEARVAVERILATLHDMHVVTGRPGTIARGVAPIDLIGLQDVDPVPLFDDGEPEPDDKEPTWRADESGERPGLLWVDDAGKDQWIGYVLALGVAWQVARDDASIDSGLVDALEDDARELGRALMVPSPYTGVDLTLIDADGRHVTDQDLNATEADGVDLGHVGNAKNALLSLSLVRTLAVVSDDAQVGAFFDEIAHERGYTDLMADVGGTIYYEYSTDYDTVAVAYGALLSWLLHETDPRLLDVARTALIHMWGANTPRATADHGGPFGTVVTAAWVPMVDADLEVAMSHLAGFGDAPWVDVYVENCDDGELQSGDCVATDGSTAVELRGSLTGGDFVVEPAYGGEIVATVALPLHLRPPSRMSWGSDPYRINGGGSDRVLSAADLRSAYWVGRTLGRAR